MEKKYSKKTVDDTSTTSFLLVPKDKKLNPCNSDRCSYFLIIFISEDIIFKIQIHN